MPGSPAKHPPVASMVNQAIQSLKERRGSSLAAIKKQMESAHHVDSHKLAPHIRRYVKKAVTQGGLVQTKGRGAAGSFRLSPKKAAAKPKRPKRPVAKKAKKPAAKRAKKPAAKKAKKPAAKKAKKPKAKAKPKKKPAARKAKPKAKPKKVAKGGKKAKRTTKAKK